MKHSLFKEIFNSRFKGYCGESVSSIDIEKVDRSIMSLKKGKASDYDGLSAEHFQYAHPCVTSVTCRLFKLMLFQGMYLMGLEIA